VASLVGGLGCSHAPSIGAVYDRKQTDEAGWKPLFDSIAAGGRWVAEQAPDALVVIYNDHMDELWLDNWPTFTIGVAEQFEIADEGFGPRAFPPVPGHPKLALHLASALVADGFDLSVMREQVVDHGILSPLPMLDQDAGKGWAVPIVPVGVNVVWDPLPSPRRCWELGKALGQAIRAYDEEIRVVVIGTGGLSHELEGEAFGTIHYEWDRKFLELIQEEPEALSRYTMEEFRRLGGHHSVEIVQWIAMRAALPDEAKAEFVYYYPKQVMGYAVAAFKSDANGG
jgi:aromatic ring-opening dioxygenase catalytic subunit (LigB family)